LGRRANVTASYVWRLENAGASPGIDLVARLAAALGTTTHDLLPAQPPEDPSAVAREQARRLFESVMQKADAHALAVLNPLLAMFLESAGKRG
jgi:transcriptional regulator with XRE-family HTH domain